MKIHPILIQQYNGRNSKTKKTCVVSNPLTTYRPNIEMPNLPVTFGSLIANSELLKMGYKVARVENNKVYTIEGNTSGDMCKQNVYDIGSSVILGYGTPAYQ